MSSRFLRRIFLLKSVTPGNRVILDSLVGKYALGIEIAESAIELS